MRLCHEALQKQTQSKLLEEDLSRSAQLLLIDDSFVLEVDKSNCTFMAVPEYKLAVVP